MEPKCSLPYLVDETEEDDLDWDVARKGESCSRKTSVEDTDVGERTTIKRIFKNGGN
jgi:hypothetical protein